MSKSLWPHGLQHTRLLCPPLSPRVCSDPFHWVMTWHGGIMMPSNRPILCCPLLLLPSIFPSIRIFSSELVLHMRWPKYWSFSFSISPSNQYSGLISFRIDWFSPCSPRDSEEPLTPQFKSINSLVLSFLYGPILTSVHDYWKNHSFD